VEKKGLSQVSDTDILEAAVRRVLDRSPDEVSAYRNGKVKLFVYFIGQIMKETRGKANPKLVNEILEKWLSG
jgi:aspartyl-tRNA(Asn)/glutamyl-tRNA(Gln) amidotransferase subunit B